VCCPESGRPVEPHELVAFVTNRKLDSAWHGVTIAKGSRLLLTPSAARFMSSAGSISVMEEPDLVLHRNGAGRGPGFQAG
jgi:hypothetical protein